MEIKMFAVTGATGQLGRLVIDALLARGVAATEITALVRDTTKAADIQAKGVQIRVADYKQPETLVAALQGVDRLLLISSSDFDDRPGQHGNVIDAAKTAGVGFVAYTSLLKAATSPTMLAADHKATEQALTASGLPHAFLRHGWYSENYASSIETGPQFGAIIGAAGEGKIHSASRADYAEADAAVLISGQTGTFELAGDDGYTKADLAKTISDVAGKPVAYKDMSESAYAEALVGVGLPDPVAAVFANADAGIAKGALEDTSKALSALIGRPTTPMIETVRAVLS
jgi:NAD(P)H dehydrogenase (quinone)